ncbi:unnamed protein product [Amoebophrya sp. A25]|nr:unnamed protein product [Amoebophrya sp. A25]|eukprot:GSA25T00019237001.1
MEDEDEHQDEFPTTSSKTKRRKVAGPAAKDGDAEDESTRLLDNLGKASSSSTTRNKGAAAVDRLLPPDEDEVGDALEGSDAVSSDEESTVDPLNILPLEGLEYLTIENFKSYGEKKVIGPFQRFTCIIGSNGSGKSNVMDALSFVLGVNTKVLRSNNLKELIHRKITEDYDPRANARRQAKVSMIFKRATPEEKARAAHEPSQRASTGMAPLGKKAKTEPQEAPGEDSSFKRRTKFTRTISRAGVGNYYLDDKAVDAAVYHRELERINILSKARNFLVFQGDIDGLTRKQGQELTKFFEQISGSDYYREECEKLLREKQQAEETARLKFTEKRDALEREKNVERQAMDAQEYMDIKKKKDALKQEQGLFQLHVMQGVVRKKEGEVLEVAKQLSELADKYREEFAEAKRKEDDKNIKVMEVGRLQLTQDEAKKVLTKATTAHKKNTDEEEKIKDRLGATYESAENMQTKRQVLNNQLAEMASELETIKTQKGVIEKNIETLETDMWTADQRAIYNETLAQSEMNNTGLTDKINKTKRELEETQRNRSEVEGNESQHQRKTDRVRARAEKEKNDVDKLTSKINNLEAHDPAAHLQIVIPKLNSLKEKYAEVKKRLAKLDEKVDEEKDNRYQKNFQNSQLQTIKSLMERFPGAVYGRVMDLVKPTLKEYGVAITTAIGMKNCQTVVVKDQDAARRCVQFLKDHDRGQMSFLPLEGFRAPRTQSATQGEAMRKLKNCKLALDCIDYHKDYAIVFQHFLSNSVICQDVDVSRDVKFTQGKKLKLLHLKVVTYHGQMIRENGNMVFDPQSNSLQIVFNELEIEQAKTERDDLSRALTGLEQEIGSVINEKRKLEEESTKREANIEHARRQLHLANEVYEKSKAEQSELVQEGMTLTAQKNALSADEMELTKQRVELSEQQKNNDKKLWAEASKKIGRKTADGKVDAHAYKEEQDQKIHHEKEQLKALRKASEDIDHETQVRNDELTKLNDATLKAEIASLEHEHKAIKERLFASEAALQKAKQAEYEASEATRIAKMELEQLANELQGLVERNKEATKIKEKLMKQRKEGDKTCADMMQAVVMLVDSLLIEHKTDIPLIPDSVSIMPGEEEKLLEKRANAAEEAPHPGDAVAVQKEEENPQEAADEDEDEDNREKKKKNAASKKKMGAAPKKKMAKKAPAEEAEEEAPLEPPAEEEKPPEEAKDTSSATEEDNEKSRAVLIFLDYKAKIEAQELNANKLTLAQFEKMLPWDFSLLDDDKRAVTTHEEAGPVNQRLTAEINRFDSLLSAPQFQDPKRLLRSLEKKHLVKDDAKAKMKESADAQKVNDGFELKYLEVKELRRKRFMDCFTIVKGQLDSIYKELTSTDTLEGGSAFLDVENEDAPFEGGIKYTTMPPAKRFRDMHLLSGGEKTLAALALCFAVHHYQKPPFIILDEVDAPLDSYNVKSIRRYLSKSSFQSIVISLKDELFCQADGLFGVYKDEEKEQSGTLSCRDFRLPLGEDAE